MTTRPDPPAAPLAMARPTGLLFVCLGNICRSPAAEGVFLHLIGLQGLAHAFTVDSAGTGNWHVGRPADARMCSAAARRGIALPSQARQITRSDLSHFDHVLTMDRQNLRAVRGLAGPGACAQITPLTRYCRRYSVEEVPDPYYGGEEGFDRVLDLLEDACGGLLESLKAERTRD